MIVRDEEVPTFFISKVTQQLANAPTQVMLLFHHVLCLKRVFHLSVRFTD